MPTGAPKPVPPSPLPIQFVPMQREDFTTDGGVRFFNQQMTQIVTTLQALLGVGGGPTRLLSGVDVAGARITGLSTPSSPTDAVSAAHADATYSAPALSPQLDVGGRHALKGLTYLFLNRGVISLNGLAGVLSLVNTDGSITIGPNADAGTILLSATAGGSGINRLTGDVLAGPGVGSQPATLATVNPDVGSFTNANITVNAKGLVTAAASGSGGGGSPEDFSQIFQLMGA